MQVEASKLTVGQHIVDGGSLRTIRSATEVRVLPGGVEVVSVDYGFGRGATFLAGQFVEVWSP